MKAMMPSTLSVRSMKRRLGSGVLKPQRMRGHDVLEVTLRGQVLPLQGVNEIVQAALRHVLRVLLLQ
jgi:ATP-dependent Lon protease